MARPGRFEHLKADILLMFSQELKPNDILKQFPDIPTTTVYRWFTEWQNGSAKPKPKKSTSLTIVSSEPRQHSETKASSSPPSRSKTVSFRKELDNDLNQWSDETDLSWLKRVLKFHIINPVRESGTVVQGCNAMVRIIEVEHNIPQSKWDRDADFEPAAIETMEAAELGRGYADAIRQPDAAAG